MSLESKSHDTETHVTAGHISAHNNGAAMLLAGDDHVYTEWFPKGTTNGRSAYMGFPGTGYWSTAFILNNEVPNGDIHFRTNGTGKCIFNKLGSIHIQDNNANMLNLEGVDHGYMGFYPDGIVNGRKAWFGFGSPNNNTITLKNEHAVDGHIVMSPGGSNGKVHVTNDLQVDGKLIQSSVLSTSDVYAQCKDAVTSLLMRKGAQYYVGTGFFISADGTIATAGHNLLNTNIQDRMDEIWATVTNVNGQVGTNRVYACTHVGVDGAGDIGVLKVTGLTSQTFLQWGDVSSINIGDECYVIGDPMGVDVASIAKGVIRDKRYVDVNGQAVVENMFVDCIAYGGNSGSPILDVNGKVIGIYTFGFTNTEGLGGGPSQSMAESVVNTIVAQQSDFVQKGFLGMQWNAVTHQTVVTNGISLSFDLRGVEIVQIVAGSPMATDFQVGDIVVEIDGQELGNLGENQTTPSKITWFKTSGQQVTLKYIRPPSADVLTKTVTLAAFPAVEDEPLKGNMNTVKNKAHQVELLRQIV